MLTDPIRKFRIARCAGCGEIENAEGWTPCESPEVVWEELVVADAAAVVAALDRIEAALAFDELRPWFITQQAADARRALRGLREAISGEWD